MVTVFFCQTVRANRGSLITSGSMLLDCARISKMMPAAPQSWVGVT